MPTNQEIAAAHEMIRLADFQTFDASQQAGPLWDLMVAYRTLYEADHPADGDEPVTEEWLKSIGFIPDPDLHRGELLYGLSDSGVDIKIESNRGLHYWFAFVGDGLLAGHRKSIHAIRSATYSQHSANNHPQTTQPQRT